MNEIENSRWDVTIEGCNGDPAAWTQVRRQPLDEALVYVRRWLSSAWLVRVTITARGMTQTQDQSPAAQHTASATWKARRMFPSGVEALVISRQASEPPTATPLYRIDANLGWADEIVATDLYWHVALGIAHALDAIYLCGVYEDGNLL